MSTISYCSAYQNRRQATLDRGSFRVTAVYADGATHSRKFGKWSEAARIYDVHENDERVVYALLVMLNDERNETERSNRSFTRSTPRGAQP